MNEILIKVSIIADEESQDALIGLLCLSNYEGFEQEDNVLHAYIYKTQFNELELRSILNESHSFSWSEIAPQNWNRQWEESYRFVELENFCLIYSSFHKKTLSEAVLSSFKYHIQVDPKMAFGTGKHDTTRTMMRLMSKLTFENLNVLDMGCGTGILGILAKKMGASNVVCIDNDPIAIINAEENTLANDVADIRVVLGDEKAIDDSYDVIIANITRNVLIAQSNVYAKRQLKGGRLLVSGFIREDETVITDCFTAIGYRQECVIYENEWLGIQFVKQ